MENGDKREHGVKPLTVSLGVFVGQTRGTLEKDRNEFRAKHRLKFVDRKWLDGVGRITR